MTRQKPAETPRTKRRRRWPLVLGVLGALLVAGAGVAVAGVHELDQRYESALHREDLLGAAAPSAEPSRDAPPPKVSGPLNFLLIGTDSRADDTGGSDALSGRVTPGSQRSDVVMLVHVPKSADRAFVVSIPRDTYVPIANRDGTPGHSNKINAAYSWGGAPRLVQTVNALTGARIDYPIIVDFAGIRRLTDLVGGVDVVVDKTAVDKYRFLPEGSPYPSAPCRDPEGRARRCVVFHAGTVHLDGKLAEYYVRQRKGLPNDDFDRAKRHQQYLHALMTKVAARNLLTDPVGLDRLVRTAADAITVDRRMPVLDLALSLRSLRPDNATFLTLPIDRTTEMAGIGSVMIPNRDGIADLRKALRTDAFDEYVARHPPNDVSHGR